MRVLHIDTGEQLRGGQRQALLLASALRDAGHENVLLCRPGSPLRAAAVTADIQVGDPGLRNVWTSSARADLVHAHDARAHSIAAVAARKPFVVSRRVAFPVRRSVFSRWKYARAARYLAVSRFVREELCRAGVPGEKIDVVYDGIGVTPPAEPWSPENPVVALASDDPGKGSDLAVRAATLASVPLRLSNDLHQDLRSASAFLYLSRSEGLGSAVLLAMSMGVPVIASRVGGVPEALAGGEAGVLVDNDPSEIAAAIRSVLTDAGGTLKLIERAESHVRACFSTEQLVDRTLSSYRRALGEPT